MQIEYSQDHQYVIAADGVGTVRITTTLRKSSTRLLLWSSRTSARKCRRAARCVLSNLSRRIGRPTLEELRQDLRAVSKKCRPDWDIASPNSRRGGNRVARNFSIPTARPTPKLLENRTRRVSLNYGHERARAVLAGFDLLGGIEDERPARWVETPNVVEDHADDVLGTFKTQRTHGRGPHSNRMFKVKSAVVVKGSIAGRSRA
jgi:hypothetical protein